MAVKLIIITAVITHHQVEAEAEEVSMASAYSEVAADLAILIITITRTDTARTDTARTDTAAITITMMSNSNNRSIAAARSSEPIAKTMNGGEIARRFDVVFNSCIVSMVLLCT